MLTALFTTHQEYGTLATFLAGPLVVVGLQVDPAYEESDSTK